MHDWAMVASGTSLGAGIGWTICDCDHGLIAGTLLGGGGTAIWEAMKHDSAARSTYNRLSGNTNEKSKKAKKTEQNATGQQ